jgi:predicted permease
MGLPLMKALYGDDGVFYGSFYIVAFNIVLWTYGYMMIGGRGSRKQVLKKVFANPSIVAVYIGMIIFIFSIRIPEMITGAVDAVGNMTMPLSMLIIGAVISTAKLRTVFSDWRVYFAGAVRLLVMPLIAICLTFIPGIPHMPVAVLVTALAMPAAANTTVFSELFNKDAIFASKCVSVSTLLSILTIPLVVSLIPGA